MTTANDEKLQKVLARAGLGSRREMERAIADGRVRVNGKPAQLGDRVTDKDKIALDGRALHVPTAEAARGRVLLYNKPEGEICSRRDPEGRRSVFEKLPKLRNGRWIAVGRLDYNTSGLLLFTTDGELANKLMHPSTQIEREYLCRVMGDINPGVIQRLVEGVLLDDGVARFTDIVEGRGEGVNKWFYVVIMEGRNREVRRLWESQGLQVSRLKRVRYGNTFIPSRVKQGQFAELTPAEVTDIYQMAGLSLGPEAPVESRKASSKNRKNK